MFGLDLMTVGGLLILATNSIQCTVPKAPQIVVNPVTHDIKYNYSYSSEELSRVDTGSVSPYAPNVDASTGGLRHDTPLIETSLSWGVKTYRHAGASCMWYDKISVTITLRPEIYVSKDYKSDSCREAILQHEERHVQVDRIVMNRYAQELGIALQNKLKSVGAVGPYNESRQDEMQAAMTQYIEDTINAQEAKIQEEMKGLQAQVDSLSEYETISKICHVSEREETQRRLDRAARTERNQLYNR